MKNSKGFTLIEVLLAMTILAFLTFTVTQGMRRGADFKTKNQRNIDQRSLINSAMRLIERDINLAFHYQDINQEVLKEVKKSGQPQQAQQFDAFGNPIPQQQQQQQQQPGQPTQPGQPPAQQKPKYDFKIREIPNYTAFVGSKQALHFSNLNGTPTAGEQLSGDQQEVGYFLRNCRSLDSDQTSSCLFRRTSKVVDKDIDEGGEEVVIIENVKKFELRYFGETKEDWVDNWKTNEEGDDLTRGVFPQAVEVTLTVEKDKRELSAIRVIPLRFPNNSQKKQPAPGTTR